MGTRPQPFKANKEDVTAQVFEAVASFWGLTTIHVAVDQVQHETDN